MSEELDLDQLWDLVDLEIERIKGLDDPMAEVDIETLINDLQQWK